MRARQRVRDRTGPSQGQTATGLPTCRHRPRAVAQRTSRHRVCACTRTGGRAQVVGVHSGRVVGRGSGTWTARAPIFGWIRIERALPSTSSAPALSLSAPALSLSAPALPFSAPTPALPFSAPTPTPPFSAHAAFLRAHAHAALLRPRCPSPRPRPRSALRAPRPQPPKLPPNRRPSIRACAPHVRVRRHVRRRHGGPPPPRQPRPNRI